MVEPNGDLRMWSWVFLLMYIGIMAICGVLGMRRVKSGDDFATARGSYGAIFLSFALVATTASGATFLGLPAITYKVGLSGLWYAFIYPLGVYGGILLCLRAVTRAGRIFGNRSIPEYLGDRYQSELLRLSVAIFSLLLLFYLAGQLLAGTVMFEQMMGIPKFYALAITSGVLLVYIAIGGAHADILTDGIQGALMIIIALGVIAMFMFGFGVDGGLGGVLNRLESLDPDTTKVFNPKSSIVTSSWDVFAIFAAHLPLGMLPHIGNKLWALKDNASRRRFMTLSFVLGLLMPGLALGGLLARAVLGDELLTGEYGPNYSIPALFITLLPSWLAALLGAGVLAAVMSTADGLAVSASQIFANDIYRCSLAPRYHKDRGEAYIDKLSLRISRIATAFVLIGAMGMAWAFQDLNVALLVWAGIGGMMAALAGPFMLGVFWRRLSRSGALLGFFAGAIVFIVLKSGGIHGEEGVLAWLSSQSSNPFACATLGGGASVIVSVLGSLFSEPLPSEHLDEVFGRED